MQLRRTYVRGALLAAFLSAALTVRVPSRAIPRSLDNGNGISDQVLAWVQAMLTGGTEAIVLWFPPGLG